MLQAPRLSTGLYLGLTANRCTATPQEPEMKASRSPAGREPATPAGWMMFYKPTGFSLAKN